MSIKKQKIWKNSRTKQVYKSSKKVFRPYGVKHLFKVKSKDPGTTLIAAVLLFLLLIMNKYFPTGM